MTFFRQHHRFHYTDIHVSDKFLLFNKKEITSLHFLDIKYHNSLMSFCRQTKAYFFIYIKWMLRVSNILTYRKTICDRAAYLYVLAEITKQSLPNKSSENCKHTITKSQITHRYELVSDFSKTYIMKIQQRLCKHPSPRPAFDPY